jgi:hypothetical protein
MLVTVQEATRGMREIQVQLNDVKLQLLTAEITGHNCSERMQSSFDAVTRDSKMLIANVSSVVQRAGNDVRNSIEQSTRSIQNISITELRAIAAELSTLKMEGAELRRTCVDNITQQLTATAEQVTAMEQRDNSQDLDIVRDIASLRNDVTSGNVRLLQHLNTTVGFLKGSIHNASLLQIAEMNSIFARLETIVENGR